MDEKVFISAEGLEEVKERLAYLKGTRRKEVADKLIKKYLSISEMKRLQQEKRELFNMILEKYNVKFYYTEKSQFIIEYEDSILYINIDESKCLASNPIIYPKTSEFNTLKLDKMTEDFKNLNKDLQLLKEKYND